MPALYYMLFTSPELRGVFTKLFPIISVTQWNKESLFHTRHSCHPPSRRNCTDGTLQPPISSESDIKGVIAVARLSGKPRQGSRWVTAPWSERTPLIIFLIGMSFFSIVLWHKNEASSHVGLTWSSQEMADLRWQINWWLLAWVSHTCECQWVCSRGGSWGIPEYSYEYIFHSSSSKRVVSIWEKQDVPLVFNFFSGTHSITIYCLKKIIVEVIFSPNIKCYWNFKNTF